MEIRRIKNRRVMDQVMQTLGDDETLDDLNEGDVFIRCLDANDGAPEARPELMACYNEIVQIIKEEDVNAE